MVEAEQLYSVSADAVLRCTAQNGQRPKVTWALEEYRINFSALLESILHVPNKLAVNNSRLVRNRNLNNNYVAWSHFFHFSRWIIFLFLAREINFSTSN